MSLETYITKSERSGPSRFTREDDIVVNYPLTSSRVIVKETITEHNTYLNTTTLTWWTWDTQQNKYVDTHISANISEEDLKTLLNNVLPTINVSVLNNDANYATSSEDVPLTITEVQEILQ